MNDLKWILTKDHVPTFEECKGKSIVYHRTSWRQYEIAFVECRYNRVFFEKDDDNIDRYILINIPEYIPEVEPVPCRVCGRKAQEKPSSDCRTWCIYCRPPANNDHDVYFYAPTRDEAVKLWNKHNGG